MNYLIGIDLGTSATKTVLFDQECNVVASATVEYPMYQPENGWAEQDPADWKNAGLATIKEVLEKSGVSGEDVKGIGLSGQMHGLVMLDENNEVIRPSIIWCDQRTGAECEEITRKVGKERLIEITANPALTGFTASKILWVRNHEPENYARCRHILLPKDYLRFVLTGVYATEVSDASGMQLLDVPNRCWSDEVLEKLDIDKSLLAKVYESPEVTGTILPEIAQMTGLSTSTVVVGGAGDNAAAAVGTGVVEDGKAFATIGTSGVVFAHSDQIAIDPKGRVHTFCCAVPGCWHVMGVTQAAGLSLKWFRDNFCHNYMEKAEKEGVDPYYLMDKDAEAVPAGSRRLFYLPYLMGERTPHLNPDCRGVFFGLNAIHGQPEMIRRNDGLRRRRHQRPLAADAGRYVRMHRQNRGFQRRPGFGRGYPGRRWRRALPQRPGSLPEICKNRQILRPHPRKRRILQKGPSPLPEALRRFGKGLPGTGKTVSGRRKGYGYLGTAGRGLPKLSEVPPLADPHQRGDGSGEPGGGGPLCGGRPRGAGGPAGGPLCGACGPAFG